jgi:hypothetical protein
MSRSTFINPGEIFEKYSVGKSGSPTKLGKI